MCAFRDKPRGDCKVISLDLGGGTLDATVLEISDQVYVAKASRGNTKLGGIDFENLLL